MRHETLDLPHQLGRYTLLRPLGRGGMGVVYFARDERLGRDVAVKMIAGLSDDSAVKRFWREARAAASVSHPNVCQVYEVDESPFGIYLAMELLEGESLEARLSRAAGSSAVPNCASCALAPADAVDIAVAVLGALSALHARGLVHRDVKPSNIFLTPHGAKLLDFGLARTASDDTLQLGANESGLTQPGMMIGTPRYMAPEQVKAESVDARTDIYAVGVILFEMLTGRPPFTGTNVIDIVHAVLHEHPPALQGPPAVIAIDRVMRRALAKEPAARWPSADAMAAELRAVPRTDATSDAITPVRALTRLIVPPLQLLRPDADSSFLSFSLAEAISGSLAGLRDVVVRSPSVAAKWTEERSDPRKLAAEVDADLLVLGSLLRVDDQLRATVQVVEGSSGTVLGSTSIRGQMADIFGFEDQITQGVMTLLAPHRGATDTPAPKRDDAGRAEIGRAHV